jgi:hypothetical protein
MVALRMSNQPAEPCGQSKLVIPLLLPLRRDGEKGAAWIGNEGGNFFDFSRCQMFWRAPSAKARDRLYEVRPRLASPPSKLVIGLGQVGFPWRGIPMSIGLKRVHVKTKPIIAVNPFASD